MFAKRVKVMWTKLVKDQRGYEMSELLVIVAVLGVIATTVLSTMKGGLNGAATTVGTKIDSILSSWTPVGP